MPAARHPTPRPPMRVPPWATATLLLLCAWGAVWLGTRLVDAIRPLLPTTMVVSRNVQPLPGKKSETDDNASHPIQPTR